MARLCIRGSQPNPIRRRNWHGYSRDGLSDRLGRVDWSNKCTGNLYQECMCNAKNVRATNKIYTSNDVNKM